MKKPRNWLKTLAQLLVVCLVLFVMLRWFEHSQVYHPDRHLDATPAAIGRPFEEPTKGSGTMAEFDIVGDDLVLGDEMGADYDIVGAGEIGARRRKMSSGLTRYAAGQPMARRPGNQDLVLRRQILPVPNPGSIADTASATVNAQPQRVMRIERLIVPAGFEGLLITDIKVGQESQFVAPGEIDCSLFVADSVGIQLKGSTAGPGILVTISYLNVSGGALTPRGFAFIGYALD